MSRYQEFRKRQRRESHLRALRWPAKVWLATMTGMKHYLAFLNMQKRST
jgi:hypothetical protein